ncbi:hypothetical protein ACFLSJ_06250 [Verrucomicrobiota bacterium]
MFYEARQRWSSYILHNRGGTILEYRRYYPSHVATLECRASYKIRGLESVRDFLKKQAVKFRQKGSAVEDLAGDLLNAMSELAGRDLSRIEAEEQIGEGSGPFQGVVKPTFFSGLHYLLVYDTGQKVPDEVIRISPTGTGFERWRPLGESERQAEKARRQMILKSAYLVDNAILPEGRPVTRGDAWRVPANTFADVMGLRTERRLNEVSGSLAFRRTQSDPQFRGRAQAQIKLEGAEMDNRIVLSTIPQRQDRQRLPAASEVLRVSFVPEFGEVLVDVLDEQLSRIRVKGKAEGVQEEDCEIWGFDKEVTVQPAFSAVFDNTVADQNILSSDRQRKVVGSLLSIVRRTHPEMANVIRARLGDPSDTR